MEFSKDFFKINERFGRVLYMQDYASYVKDDMISELCDLSRDLMLSIDILPVPTDEAVREIQNRLLGVETNVTNWQRRQNAKNNFSAIMPYDMEPVSYTHHARDAVFTCIDAKKELLTFQLCDTEETRNYFPFSFQLQVTYTLKERTLEVLWQVENQNQETMYFTIGGHPGFNVPILENTK